MSDTKDMLDRAFARASGLGAGGVTVDADYLRHSHDDAFAATGLDRAEATAWVTEKLGGIDLPPAEDPLWRGVAFMLVVGRALDN